MFLEGIKFPKDMVLDDVKFAEATSKLAQLGSDMSKLQKDIEDMLSILKKGFDTPAGHKFISSCENNLLEPLKQQKLVIDHVAQNLKYAKGEYQSVFDKYQELNSLINNSQI
ncbi:MAG: hypothetical protein ACI4M3_05715 [Acutalibacteraceae bacterium]